MDLGKIKEVRQQDSKEGRVKARFILALPTQDILITESSIEYEKSIKEGFVPVNAPDMEVFTGLNIWISYKPCGLTGWTGSPK